MHAPPNLLHPGGKRGGFTLVEILAVVGIMVLMMLAAGPLLSGIKGGRDPISQAYDIAGALEQARTYAVSNNTYVWVGFFEENGAVSSPTTSGTGRVIVSVVASKDGSRYPDSGPGALLGSGSATNLSPSISLVQVSKLYKLDNIHLASATPVSSPAMPAVASAYQVGNFTPGVGTAFNYPLIGTKQYGFSKIIEFNSQGEASKVGDTLTNPLQPWLQIGLQPTHGAAIDSRFSTNVASAVMVEGATGRVRIFKP